MSVLSGQPLLSCRHLCSLKFINPNPPVFSNHRRPPKPFSSILFPRILTFTNNSELCTTSTAPAPAAANSPNSNYNPPEDAKPVTLVGEKDVPLEGVIQFEKPSFFPASIISKWGRVAVLAGGDVLALLIFSAVGRFSHGFPVVDPETLRTADPFIAGWFLSAYFLGGYGEDGRGLNGWSKAVTAAVRSWAVGIPLGMIIRTVSVGHLPPTNFILVTMGSTGVLLVGWRALLHSVFSNDKRKTSDDYKRGSPFELFELLASLVRRW